MTSCWPPLPCSPASRLALVLRQICLHDSFKLPKFWPKELVVYFQQIEVAFDQQHITASVVKYRCLMLALPQEVVTPHCPFIQIITADTPNPYELLPKCWLNVRVYTEVNRRGKRD